MPNKYNKYIAVIRDILKTFDEYVAGAEKEKEANLKTYMVDIATAKNDEIDLQVRKKYHYYQNLILSTRHDVLGRIQDWGVLRPSLITDDVKLLNGDFNVPAAQLKALAERNRNNATMLNAIQHYIDVAFSGKLPHAIGEVGVVPTANAKEAAYEKVFEGALNVLSSCLGAEHSNPLHIASVEKFCDVDNADPVLLATIGDAEELSQYKASTPYDGTPIETNSEDFNYKKLLETTAASVKIATDINITNNTIFGFTRLR